MTCSTISYFHSYSDLRKHSISTSLLLTVERPTHASILSKKYENRECSSTYSTILITALLTS